MSMVNFTVTLESKHLGVSIWKYVAAFLNLTCIGRKKTRKVRELPTTAKLEIGFPFSQLKTFQDCK
jgi:hypothetical protein